MQHFITRTGIEGVVSACGTAIGRSLIMPEFDLAGTLSLFVRDEVSIFSLGVEGVLKLTLTNRFLSGTTHT